MEKTYIDLVRLLLNVSPFIFREPFFALKGGTALNLFLRDLPRLSVDIDVVFTDHQITRTSALKKISATLAAAKRFLKEHGYSCEITSGSDGEEIKMFIRHNRVRIKVEINHVFRGTLLPIEKRSINELARNMFRTEISLPLLHHDEIYGSKLVAALDRQHPRDFFDVRELYSTSGLTPEIVECFVCYLAGHNRSLHGVLYPQEKDITGIFTNEFTGMTREPISLDELLDVRKKVFSELPLALTENHRRFLLSFVSGNPDWDLMSCKHLAQLPAIQWKMENLAKLKKSNPHKFAQQTHELRKRWDGD